MRDFLFKFYQKVLDNFMKVLYNPLGEKQERNKNNEHEQNQL